MNLKKHYRIEWLHNNQWRMEVNNGGVYPTYEDAEKALTDHTQYANGLQVRIVELPSLLVVRS